MRTIVASALSEASNAEQAAAALGAQLREKLGPEHPAIVFVFGSMAQPLDELLPRVANDFPASIVVGASTAGEFTERGDAKHASCALAVFGDFRVYAGIGTGLAHSPEAALTRALEGQPAEVLGYPHRTAVLLLDPLAGNGEETTLLASAALGDNVVLAGGAAGDYLAMKRTLVGTSLQVASDAVVVAQIFSKKPLGIGISHGHKALSAPLRVTDAEGSVVRTIDGRPAWEVWR